jgi:hypothetical protein
MPQTALMTVVVSAAVGTADRVVSLILFILIFGYTFQRCLHYLLSLFLWRTGLLGEAWERVWIGPRLLRALECFAFDGLVAGRRDDTIGIARPDVHEAMMTTAALPRQAKAVCHLFAFVRLYLGLHEPWRRLQSWF